MSGYQYEPSGWQAPGRQASWEQQQQQQQPPSRSGASSTVNSQVEPTAFAAQFEEVDRALDNLAKSGKGFGYPMVPGPRRESMPMAAPRPYPEYGMPPQRHHSVSDYEAMRPHSAASNVQHYYQNQRFAPPRGNDADQVKRRYAAQRERDLRNYHQEQQYHRNVSGSKSDRSMSPNTMSEEDRRELIARQHRALYGEQSVLYSNNNPTSSQDARVNSAGAARGASPLAFDPFPMQGNAANEGSVQMPPRDSKDSTGSAQDGRMNSNASPSNPNPAFNLFDSSQQAGRSSSASPAGSPPHQGPKTNGSGVAPIGTRPAGNQGQQPGAPLSKRATTPLPSPLSYSYNASDQNSGNNNAAATSGSLNPSATVADKGSIWGNKNGVWSNPGQPAVGWA